MLALLLAAMSTHVSAQRATPDSMRADLWRADGDIVTKAAEAHDVKAQLAGLAKLHLDFPESSVALFLLASHEQRDSNITVAARLLRDYAAMGMTVAVNNPAYGRFNSSGLLDSVPELRRNSAVVETGRLAFAIPDSTLLVEDVTWDPVQRRLLISSVHRRKIISCDLTGDCIDVVSSEPNMPLDGMFAVHVDSTRGVIWATTAGLNAQDNFQKEYQNRSAVFKFDLRSHALVKRYAPDDGRPHALGDMTVSSNGDAYISDGVSGDVYVIRHDHDTLEPLTSRHAFVSPQTPALNVDETLLYVPDYAEGIAVVHLGTGAVEWVTSAHPTALDGIDGLYWTKGALIAIQNGTSPERVVRFKLDAYNRVASTEVLDANSPGLGDPTHGVIVGGEFYYIVNSGWDRVKDDGSLGVGAGPAVRRKALVSPTVLTHRNTSERASSEPSAEP